MNIYFNVETRQFSAEKGGFKKAMGKAGHWIGHNREAVGAGAGALAGAAIGNIRARRAAKAHGFEKGSAEYKRMVRNQMLAGAGIGLAGGAAAGHLSRGVEGRIADRRGVREQMKGMDFDSKEARKEFKKSAMKKAREGRKGTERSLGYWAYGKKKK